MPYSTMVDKFGLPNRILFLDSRSIQPQHEDLRLRQTCINWLLEEACEDGGASRAGDGEFPLCGGVLYGAQAACYYCAGTPLLRGGTLYALAAGGGGCGGDCPPRRYLTTPALRDWLDDLLLADPPDDSYLNDDY